ncbi:MAG: hypothetical protein ABSD49_12225 [Candidatus Bathyarchaeia archaeon]|jgi:hypothetical protein
MSELRKLANLLKDVATQIDTHNLDSYAFGTQTGLISLTKRGAVNLNRTLNLLGEDNQIAERVPPEILRREVHTVIGTLSTTQRRGIQAESVNAAQTLITRLRNYPMSVVLVRLPIWGLEIFPRRYSISIGPVVCYSLAASGPTDPGRWRIWPLSEEGRVMLTRHGKPYGGSTYWSTITLNANPSDTEYLLEAGGRKVSQALALITLFIPTLDVNDSRLILARMHLPSLSILPLEDNSESYFVTQLTPNECFASTRSHTAWCPFEIRQSDMADFVLKGFDKCAQLLTGTTEIERRIQRSLELFSSGLVIQDEDRMFTVHITCLETLLIQPKEQGIASKLGRRLAWLIETTPAERTKVIEAIETLYTVRSSIVHRGDGLSRVMQYEWVLIQLIRRVLVTLSDKRFASVSEIITWVEQNDVVPLSKRIREWIKNALTRI